MTNARWLDAHAHLDRYGPGLEEALHEIRALDILTVSVSMDVPSWHETVSIAAAEPLVVPAFGIHPWNAHEYAHDLAALDPFIAEAPILGEVGLDHHFVKDAARYPAQRAVFEYFMDAACRTGKPLNIHTKGAESDVAELIERYAPPRILVHWYSGPMTPMKTMIEAGAYFTVGVEVLRSSRTIERIAKRIPDERLLTETDNPGGWEWLEGIPGQPALVRDVVRKLAELRGVSEDAMRERVFENARVLLPELVD